MRPACERESFVTLSFNSFFILSKVPKPRLSINLMMCHPYLVLRGDEKSFLFCKAKEAFSNSGGILFVPNQGSSPPFLEDCLSSENCPASSSNLEPAFNLL